MGEARQRVEGQIWAAIRNGLENYAPIIANAIAAQSHAMASAYFDDAARRIADGVLARVVPAEPSDEDVERVFCVLAWGSPERPAELADKEQLALAMAGNPALVRTARAAIRAFLQGGGDE